MDTKQKEEIIKKLEERGAKLPCPRCGGKNFSLIEGYFNNPLQSTIGNLVIGGPAIPSVVIACTNCGYISQHALGALGLLPSSGGSDGK